MNRVDQWLTRILYAMGISLWLLALAHTLFILWLITFHNTSTWLERGAPECFKPFWWPW